LTGGVTLWFERGSVAPKELPEKVLPNGEINDVAEPASFEEVYQKYGMSLRLGVTIDLMGLFKKVPEWVIDMLGVDASLSLGVELGFELLREPRSPFNIRRPQLESSKKECGKFYHKRVCERFNTDQSVRSAFKMQGTFPDCGGWKESSCPGGTAWVPPDHKNHNIPYCAPRCGACPDGTPWTPRIDRAGVDNEAVCDGSVTCLSSFDYFTCDASTMVPNDCTRTSGSGTCKTEHYTCAKKSMNNPCADGKSTYSGALEMLQVKPFQTISVSLDVSFSPCVPGVSLSFGASITLGFEQMINYNGKYLCSIWLQASLTFGVDILFVFSEEFTLWKKK
jgi:hypothetical protein